MHDNADAVDRVIVVCSPADDAAQRAVAESFPNVSIVAVDSRIGAGAARNLGARYAGESEYLLFVDADCRLEPGGARSLLKQAQASSSACVAASLLPSRRDPVSLVRHLLEFKDFEPGVLSPSDWMVPSATMLCRRSAFDAIGGFPDMWPGEDLVFCRRLHDGGARISRSATVVSHHDHPSGIFALLGHQVRLGRTSAQARLSVSMPGSAWALRPWFAPALFIGRLMRGMQWLLRNRPAELPVFILLGPLYLGGLGAWSYGFTVEAWRRRGSRDVGGSHTSWADPVAPTVERRYRSLEHP